MSKATLGNCSRHCSTSGIHAVVRYGGIAPPAIDRYLREAAAAYSDTAQAEALLTEALMLDPECLPVYFARYKFYFYKARLADAEQTVHAALETAARQAGFPADWTQLRHDSADWSDVTGPAHFYLFSLKALAFIRLRCGATDESRAILARLAVLDPQDNVGAMVIHALANGAGSSAAAGS